MAFFDFLHIFTDLFDSAAKAWNKLFESEQQALIKGAAIVKELNDNVAKTPDEVFEIIQKKFPDLTKESLEEILTKAAAGFNIPAPDLLTTIQNLQKYLSQFEGKFWEWASSSLAQAIAIIIAPDQTPFAKIVSLIEWVFRKRVK